MRNESIITADFFPQGVLPASALWMDGAMDGA
jgi:hypothetical protein